MKKTLFGVLAILMVLSMVFGGTLALSADDAETPTYSKNAGELPDASGIVVDGKMDDVYKQSPALTFRAAGTQAEGIYTRGVGYAAWSSEEQSIYFFFIVNDISICDDGSYPWEADGVELFVKHGDDMTLDYDDINNKYKDTNEDGKKDWGTGNRGRQYRISGYDGRATALIDCDLPSGFNWKNAYDSEAAAANGKNYLYCPDPKMKENGGTYNEHINAERNEFGWYMQEDDGERGWAYTNFDEFAGSAGYTLEYKINLPGLKAGDAVRFDAFIIDRYTGANGSDVQTAQLNYESAYRLEKGVTATDHDKLPNYDYLTMGSTKVTVADVLEEGELYDYGREDAMYPAATGDEEEKPSYQKTDKQTMDRQPGNAPAIEPTASSSSSTTTQNNQQPSGTDSDAPAGGCGSSIVLGSSVAMLALVGAAGAFAFRKKDEE